MILKEKHPFILGILKIGAVFEDVGQWKRPWYFKKNDKETMFEAVQRDLKELRKAAGILDGSTLGKIEIKGKGCIRICEFNIYECFYQNETYDSKIRTYVRRRWND